MTRYDSKALTRPRAALVSRDWGRIMHRPTLALICLLIVAVVTPLSAYTIYLKDGSTLIAKEEYRIEDGKALIVLQNGTQTFIDAAEIDVDKTERVNRGNYGTAFFIDDDGKLVEAPITPTERQTLTDVAGRTDARASNRSPATRPTAGPTEPTDHIMTKGGFVDLTVALRTPYRDLDIAVEISRFLRTLGLTEFKVFQGTAPIIEIYPGFALGSVLERVNQVPEA